ncbi:MAG: hypothetical protein A2172_00825 [Candidatus Woykebacteria bacterium RBG_13_40_15]|uniref:Uncharacterized protein n=1 Tax=Candidatus Woykebacteria bacterium RBG_13_40_15 TaxID=1802593 RepID=A0A1G1W8S1_9BACT|nr:MAG: hypothetical protein A2172_00825 [Candidatus Woykebacteria bacterium RBG_13_40_15]
MTDITVPLTRVGNLTSDLPEKAPPYPGEALAGRSPKRLVEEQKTGDLKLASATPFKPVASINYPEKNIYVAPLNNVQPSRGLNPVGSRGVVSLPIQGERVFEIEDAIRKPVEARIEKLLSQYESPPVEQVKPLLPPQGPPPVGTGETTEQAKTELENIKEAVRNELLKKGGKDQTLTPIPSGTPAATAPVAVPSASSPQIQSPQTATIPAEQQPSAPSIISIPTPTAPKQDETEIHKRVEPPQPEQIVSPPTEAAKIGPPTTQTAPLQTTPPPGESATSKLFSEAEKLQTELANLQKEVSEQKLGGKGEGTAQVGAPTTPSSIPVSMPVPNIVVAPTPPQPTPVTTPPAQKSAQDEQIRRLVTERSELLKQINDLSSKLQDEKTQKQTAQEDADSFRKKTSTLEKEKADILGQSEAIKADLVKNQQVPTSTEGLPKEIENLRSRLLVAEQAKKVDEEKINQLEDLIAGAKQIPQGKVDLVEPEKAKSVETLSKQGVVKVVKPDLAVGKMAPSLTSAPNVINGIVRDKGGLLLSNVIIVVKDSTGDPVRALKTNKIGQFAISTPLPNGTYIMELESTTNNFNNIQVELKGEVLPPIEIKAT